MSLYVLDTRVVLCNNEHVIIFNVTDKTEDVINLPLVENISKTTNSNLDMDNAYMITHLSFSKDGTYFLVCTNRKQLCLYNSKTLELISNRILNKTASKVRFTLDNDIVVADRAGDVYLFSSKFPTQNGTFMLGHVSMLLDVLVTENGKYIITADRDEKIRVSMYPNAYNIANYCLGHVKFVTNISQLAHNQNILISAGGDGTFLLWDYKNGKEISCVNFTEKLPQIDISNFNKLLQDSNFDEIIQNLPVKHLRVSLHGTSSLVLISFHSSQTILIYEISGNVDSTCRSEYVQSIISDGEPLDCFMENENLWILSNNGVSAYEFKDTKFLLNNSFNDELKKLNGTWNKLTNNLSKQNLFHILYRKKFDNVQEYLERKKLRLTNVTE